jgi:tRNA threonylcarbamoyladenosine biosynthesis protein TsaB
VSTPGNISPQPPTLFIDTASPRVACGLLSGEADAPIWQTSTEEAGIGLFHIVDAVLRQASLDLSAIRTVVFCDGPGSLLGVRLTAMALRTWMALPRAEPLRVLAYRSLELLAADLVDCGRPQPFAVITDARRGTWNLLRVTPAENAEHPLGLLERWPAGRAFPVDLPLLSPEGFPNWQPLPEGTEIVPYRPQRLPDLVVRHSLLRATEHPDAFLIETPTYRTWTPPSTAANAAPVDPAAPS